MKKDFEAVFFLRIVLLLCVATTFIYAQAPDTLLTRLYGRICNNLVQQKFNKEDIVEATGANFNSGPELLLKGNLGGVYVGFSDAHLEILSFGIGFGYKWLGFIATTKLAELYPSGYSGDFLLTGSLLPMYIYVTSGLYSEKKRNRPVFYMFAGKNIFGALYNQNYVCLGGGMKWTLWIISPALQVGWRRVWSEMGTGHNDFTYIGLNLELGGWWAR